MNGKMACAWHVMDMGRYRNNENNIPPITHFHSITLNYIELHANEWVGMLHGMRTKKFDKIVFFKRRKT